MDQIYAIFELNVSFMYVMGDFGPSCQLHQSTS